MLTTRPPKVPEASMLTTRPPKSLQREGTFQWIKELLREFIHSPDSTIEFMTAWSYIYAPTPTPPTFINFLYRYVSINDGDTF
jgi:hypothetical protein